MKKLIIILVVIFNFSCCKNDDDNGGLDALELNKNFLVDEKWFLESLTSDISYDLNGDGNKTTNLMSQVNVCDLDSYYQFEALQEDIVVLYEGDDVCSDNFETYSGATAFSIDAENKYLIMGIGSNKNLLGRFEGVSYLKKVEFTLSPDSSFKLIKSEIQVLDENNDIVVIEYVLKASVNDRP